jgi:tetraacyldisaccharide 4'-kinase
MDVVLWPAEVLFRAGVALRNRAFDRGFVRAERATIPVVSVGNLAVGGAGKTPFSAWVAGRLAEWGSRPAVVLRGYGADEVLVHREINPGVPVFTAARRIDAVLRAAAEGCDVAILDDAFQHRRLARDLDLVLLAADGWGDRRRLLPRGAWREGLQALARADLVIVTRKAATEAVARDVERMAAGVVGAARVVRCRIEPAGLLALRDRGGGSESVPLDSLRGTRVLAVTSLADPRSFMVQLQSVGADVELVAFPDHHDFTASEADALVRRSAGRPILVSRKEAVKLRELLPIGPEAWMVDQRVVIESNEGALDEALRGRVG